MQFIKRILSTATLAACLIGTVNAAPAVSKAIHQRYAAGVSKTLAARHFGTHMQIVNLSSEYIYVRVEGSDQDLLLYPVGSGQNIDYIDSDYTYDSLRVSILADDDYTVLRSWIVYNGETKYYPDDYRLKVKK